MIYLSLLSRSLPLKNITAVKVIFLSLVLSSCGLIEKFKTPEQPTDSKEAEMEVGTPDQIATTEPDATDDLFSQTMAETSESSTGVDAPMSNTAMDEELKSLESEFSSSTAVATPPAETEIAVTPTQTNSTVKQEAPVLVEEALPEIKTEVEPAVIGSTNEVKFYKVQRGETLMQIAFKIYGDISKWKDIRNMNSDKISSYKNLSAGTHLKYRAPATAFTWNPGGTPYLIKQGETLGTISNTVYSTPKKWKAIWENNKPLIKNPNVIYAGFTLYYTNGGMANYVQPKADQPKVEIIAKELSRDAELEAALAEAQSKMAKEEKEEEVEATLAKDEAFENLIEEVEVSKAVIAAPKREVAAENAAKITAKDEQQVDEAIQTLSSTKRDAVKSAVEKITGFGAVNEGEIDLINNVSAPYNSDIAPDIDEEVQTLE